MDVLGFASGFEVTTDLDHRLGFSPKGRGGVAMSERWHDGAHTLHGILTAEFPNLLMISLVQAGFGTNFLHFLSESAKHVAWLITACEEEGHRHHRGHPRGRGQWLKVLYREAARWRATRRPARRLLQLRTGSQGVAQPGLHGQPHGLRRLLVRWREERLRTALGWSIAKS